jgi:response regulator RpfG family c-di-GMP phosphodiesterase
MSSAYKLLKQNSLAFDLHPLDLRVISALKIAPCDIFTFRNEEFDIALYKGSRLNSSTIKSKILSGNVNFFVKYADYPLLKEQVRENLRQLSRSLSIGEPIEKLSEQMYLATIHLGLLYDDPTDEMALETQYQSILTLAQNLGHHYKLIPKLYVNLSNQNFHYIHAQPMLSSLLLICFLKFTYHFNEKEMENLFITSYFKDIGMSLVPRESLKKEKLSLKEKMAFHNHGQYSLNILQGKIPLSNVYLGIIKHHHSHSLIKPDQNGLSLDIDSLTGVETLLVSTMDTIAAMTSNRPYRSKMTFYEALSVIKALMANQYSQEFKYLVSFFQTFFKGI